LIGRDAAARHSCLDDPITFYTQRAESPGVWIAHELCHRPFVDPEVEGVHVVIDFDGDRHVHEAERRARAFAAELLLPDAGLRKAYRVPPQG